MEVGRIDLTMGKPAAPVETLKIALTRTDATDGKLNIAWENVTGAVYGEVNRRRLISREGSRQAFSDGFVGIYLDG